MRRYCRLLTKAENPTFDYEEFDRKMRESQQHVDKIKKGLGKVDKEAIEKKLQAKITKVKAGLNPASNMHLIHDLKQRK